MRGFYEELNRYRDGPTEARANELRVRFEERMAITAEYPPLAACIERTAGRRERLLATLEEPRVPTSYGRIKFNCTMQLNF